MFKKLNVFYLAAIIAGLCLLPHDAEAVQRSFQAKSFNPGAGAIGMARNSRNGGHRRPGNIKSGARHLAAAGLLIPAVQAARDYPPPTAAPCPNPLAHTPGC
jgi:hypothetical protein